MVTRVTVAEIENTTVGEVLGGVVKVTPFQVSEVVNVKGVLTTKRQET